MNVLILTDKLIHGGAENYFCRLENEIRAPDLTVYTAAGPGELEAHIKHKENFHLISRTKHVENIRTIKRIILERNIDIVHANSLRMVMYLSSIKMTMRKKHPFTVVYTKHNVTALEKYSSIFSKFVNTYVDRVIAVSEFERQNLIEKGVDASKVSTVYNGVNLERFQFRSKQKGEQFKVGILARLSEEKNHRLFIEIANELRDVSNVMFYIAGDGPEREAITAHIDSLGLENISLLGNTSSPEEFIKEMDLMVLTSKREVFPMVMLEAMATGTPLVAVDVGGVKEAVIHNETGFLLKQYSADQFCDIIKELVENDEVSRRLASCAREKVEREFSMEKMVERTVAEYMQVKS